MTMKERDEAELYQLGWRDLLLVQWDNDCIHIPG